MKKALFLIFILLFANLVEASTVSLSVSWQLSTQVLHPGSEATISITLTNAGLTDMSNVVVTASPGPYLKIISGKKIELGAIRATSSQQAVISIKVDENATSTTSYVFLEVDYYTGTSSYEKSLYIPVTIRREPIIEIKDVSYSEKVEPGKTVSISFYLKNSGEGAAKDLKITLEQGDVFTTPSSSGEVVISILEPSKSKKVSIPITINPDTSIGVYSIPVKLSYYDETRSTSYSETKNIGLTVSGKAEFVITANTENLFSNSIGELEISIANSGTSSAQYLTAKISSDYGSEEIYVGTLDPDDYETIKVYQDLVDVSKEYPVKVFLKYRDEFNNEHTFEKILTVKPKPKTPDIFLGVIIVIGVVVLFFLIYKRRK